MSVQLIKLNNGGMSVVATYSERDLELLTIEAIHETNIEVAKIIAGEVMKSNKDRIMKSIDLTLIISEIEKSILQKLKAEVKKDK